MLILRLLVQRCGEARGIELPIELGAVAVRGGGPLPPAPPRDPAGAPDAEEDPALFGSGAATAEEAQPMEGRDESRRREGQRYRKVLTLVFLD